jgi:hypothetical protein
MCRPELAETFITTAKMTNVVERPQRSANSIHRSFPVSGWGLLLLQDSLNGDKCNPEDQVVVIDECRVHKGEKLSWKFSEHISQTA